MSDYRVKINIRNNRILSTMEEQGYVNPNTIKNGNKGKASIATFSRAFNLDHQRVGKIISGKIKPIGEKGEILPLTRKILDALNLTIDEAFTKIQLKGFKRNTYELQVKESQLKQIVNPNTNPELILMEQQVNETLESVLNCLTFREKEVVLERNNGITLEELSQRYEISRERVRQIEKVAHFKLASRINVEKFLNAGIKEVFPDLKMKPIN